MEDFDVNILKLQYEILNVPLAILASETGLPESILQSTITEQGWVQWWPETSMQQCIEDSCALSADSDNPSSAEELMTAQADAFSERTRKRLQVYSLAKEIYLSQRYLKLESALISKAHTIIGNLSDNDAQSIKQLSALYKDMMTKSPMSQMLSLGQDENGMPSVILRDLTGS